MDKGALADLCRRYREVYSGAIADVLDTRQELLAGGLFSVVYDKYRVG